MLPETERTSPVLRFLNKMGIVQEQPIPQPIEITEEYPTVEEAGEAIRDGTLRRGHTYEEKGADGKLHIFLQPEDD